MVTPSFTSAARSLALPIDNESDDDAALRQYSRRSPEQTWTRRSISSPTDLRPRTRRDRWMQTAEAWQRQYIKAWNHLTPLQRIGVAVAGLTVIVLGILFLIFNQSIFALLGPAAAKWRKIPGGWVILWFMTFFVSFPPLIGFSSCVTIAGFVFGMPGWFIVATATVVGSTCAFIVSRGLLRDFVSRLTERNQKFAALSSVLKHDGLKLLIMIRFCPLPYSLSNGAISTIPTVTWQNFALATAVSTVRLLLHVFVGSRLGDLAENGDKMDLKTKLVSYFSIAFGVLAGIATGYIVYVRTQARAKQLEAEGITSPYNGQDSGRLGSSFIDDPDDQRSFRGSRRADDEISMHTSPDVESGQGSRFTYQDEFTDDEDATERDVFDVGDGEDEDDDTADRRYRR